MKSIGDADGSGFVFDAQSKGTQMTALKNSPDSNPKSNTPGSFHVLTIGVSRQVDGSGFSPLARSENDALAIRDCFLNYPQLSADTTRVSSLTTKSGSVSRGAVLAAVKNLASGTGPDNRLLLYFSGHGIRIKDQIYLVPEDAYDAEDPGCLVGLDQIWKFLDKSKAEQKFVILDACWFQSEDPASENGEESEITGNFLSDYFGGRKGTIVLVSGADSEASIESPDPRLSLLTYHIKAALGGAKDSLDGKYLTLNSLYKYVSDRVKEEWGDEAPDQLPLLANNQTKPIILGDFTPRVVESSLSLGSSPISCVQFVGSEALRVKDVLTAIRKTYSAQYIASRVNETLAEHFQEDLGRAVARLKNNFDFPEDDVYAEGPGIRFPGGRYWLEYLPETDKAGWLLEHVTFFSSWFSKPQKIAEILETLDLRPSEIRMGLSTEITLKQLIPGMKANGWKLESQLEHKAEFSQGSYQLGLEIDAIAFRGFQPAELLGQAETRQSKIAGGILHLLPKSNS